MAYDIGGMLARSGATTGQLMGGGIANVGAGLGGLLTRRKEKQSEQNAQEQFQQILAANRNNPDVLRAKGQELATSGDPNLQRVGKMLMDEATRVTGVQTAKTEKGTAQGIQGGLSAVTQAAMRGVPLTDLQEGIRSVTNLGGTQAQIIDAYKAGADIRKGEKPDKPKYKYSTAEIEVDGKTEVVQIGVNENDPNDRVVTTIGAVATETGEDKSLQDMIDEAGLDPKEYNLTTLGGLENVQRFIVSEIGNASLANTVGDMIDRMKPPGVGEAFDLLNKVDPLFREAQVDLASVAKFKGLEELTDENISGLKPLLERIVSGTTDSDVRAVAELDQFRGNKDIINKFNDFVLGVTVGRLSEDTVKEYGQIMEVVSALAQRKQLNTINSLILSEDPRESEAALRAKNFILNGRGQARIIPSS